MNRRWLLVGLILSCSIHGVFLWPILAGSSSSSETTPVLVDRMAPPVVDVSGLADPPPAEPPSTASPPEPPAPAAESRIASVLPEEPPAPARTEMPIEESSVDPATSSAMALEATAAAAATGAEPPMDASVSPGETPRSAVTTDSPDPIVRSRTVAMMESRSEPSAAPPPPGAMRSRAASMNSEPASHREEPAAQASDAPTEADVARRIASARARASTSHVAVRNPHDGDHLSTQNGPARVVPQIEWRSLARWRSVASAAGLRLMSLASDGSPAALIEESNGGWRRVPIESTLRGFSPRVRIVDHVAAFQPARSGLLGGERLAILVPQSLETLMDRAMVDAIHQRGLDVSEVAVCSGVLQPGGPSGVVFRVDRVSSRRSS